MNDEMPEHVEIPDEHDPELDPAMIEVAFQKFEAEQNMVGGFLAGAVAALVGAGVWALVTVLTGYQIGFMAIGVGFLVGLAVQFAGKGINKIFGVMGARGGRPGVLRHPAEDQPGRDSRIDGNHLQPDGPRLLRHRCV
jgi:hypothetical protein